MDNKVRRALAAVISAALVASAACVPSFASGTQPAATPAPADTTKVQAAALQSNDSVAKIGDKTYASLQGAIDYAQKQTGSVTIKVLKDVDESVTIANEGQKENNITLTSADSVHHTIKQIVLGNGSHDISITGLNFIVGTGGADDESIIVHTAKNVTIEKNTFSIKDNCIDISKSKQYTSIWLQQYGNQAPENINISGNTFNLTNCPLPDASSNVAIAFQDINSKVFPKNLTISNNQFNSTAIPAEDSYANTIGVMLMGASGTLEIDSNKFYETVQSGAESNFTNVAIAGNVCSASDDKPAEIKGNQFAGYYGVELYRLKWGDTIAAKGSCATIQENGFNCTCGIYAQSCQDGEGNIYPPFNEGDVTVSGNTGKSSTVDYFVGTAAQLKNALTTAPAGTTIKLATDITCTEAISIPTDGITIDGQGHSLTLNSKLESGAFITATGKIDQPLENVTLKDLTVNADGYAKHGINYYCTTGGTIENVTVNGGSWTSIQANGAQGLTIENCTTKPGKGAYTNIEYGMGEGVKTVPSVTIKNVDWDRAYSLVYMDNDTLDRVKTNSTGELGENPSNAAVQQYIMQQINMPGESCVWKWDNNTNTLIAVNSPTPPSGGGSSSSKPMESISLNATTAQLAPNGTEQLKVSYTPSDTTPSKDITWTSSDEKVATVDQNGKVTAVSKTGGTATITAKVGDKTATCTVVVNPFTLKITDLDGTTTTCALDGSTVIQVPQSAAYTFDIASEATIDSFGYNAGNGGVGGTNTIAKWNGASGTYQAYAAGKVGEKTGMYVNGIKLFTLEVTARPFTSDTTLTTPVQVGHPYTFRIQLNDPKADFTFLTANGKVLSTSYKKENYPDKKGDYYCTITAKEAVGDVGVYVNVAGKTYKVFAARCVNG